MGIETRIEGSPASIRSTSTWLRGTLKSSTSTFADSAFLQRSRSESAWNDPAGDAFRTRVNAVAKAADTTSTEAGTVATNLDVLAKALEDAQTQMASALSIARAGGLTIDGTVIESPGAAPPDTGPAPTGADATTAAIDAYDGRVAAMNAHNAKVTAWNKASAIATQAEGDWETALTNAEQTWAGNAGNLATVGSTFLTATFSAALILKLAPILSKQSQFLKDGAMINRSHLSSMIKDGKWIGGDKAHFYDLLDKSKSLDAQAIKLAEDAKNVKFPKGLGRGLGAIGVLTTGYAIYDDIQNGESPAQAATSNGVGMLAAIGASAGSGALIGAAVGTFIPIPGVGTAVGVVGGAVVGTAVGIFTSGMIDSMWENGVDNIGDVGDAMMDGLDEVGDTAKDIGNLAGDAWNAVF